MLLTWLKLPSHSLRKSFLVEYVMTLYKSVQKK